MELRDTVAPHSHRGSEIGGPIDAWRLHDIRRTAGNRHEEPRVLPHVVETVINHRSGHKAGVAGIYNRASVSRRLRERSTFGPHISTPLFPAASGRSSSRSSPSRHNCLNGARPAGQPSHPRHRGMLAGRHRLSGAAGEPCCPSTRSSTSFSGGATSLSAGSFTGVADAIDRWSDYGGAGRTVAPDRAPDRKACHRTGHSPEFFGSENSSMRRLESNSVGQLDHRTG